MCKATALYYRFVGYLELPTSDDENYKANTRKGVDVEYIPTAKSGFWDNVFDKIRVAREKIKNLNFLNFWNNLGVEASI